MVGFGWGFGGLGIGFGFGRPGLATLGILFFECRLRGLGLFEALDVEVGSGCFFLEVQRFLQD